MAVAKEETHRLQTEIFRARSGEGLQAMRAFLWVEKERYGRLWPLAMGADLVMMQGEMKVVQRLLDLIDTGPKVRNETPPEPGSAKVI